MAADLAIAVFAGVLSFLSWDRADQVAGVVSALAGVAALGAGVYAVLAPAAAVRVARTGRATSKGRGDANTGLLSSGPAAALGPVSVGDTGDARADGGTANTCVRQR
ncbi:hypothetical protein ACF073_34785 [Streptomyces sp. NPDC015171]|uniref:hypothetical protein n=1 Tax=Streptomyces sp. NPDC015171 TaxID=3364945 RepID=UPI0036FBC359